MTCFAAAHLPCALRMNDFGVSTNHLLNKPSRRPASVRLASWGRGGRGGDASRARYFGLLWKVGSVAGVVEVWKAGRASKSKIPSWSDPPEVTLPLLDPAWNWMDPLVPTPLCPSRRRRVGRAKPPIRLSSSPPTYPPTDPSVVHSMLSLSHPSNSYSKGRMKPAVGIHSPPSEVLDVLALLARTSACEWLSCER